MPARVRGVPALLVAWAIVPFCGAATSAAERSFDWTVGAWTGIRRDAQTGAERPMTLRVASVLGGLGQIREIDVGGAETRYLGFAVQVLDRDRGVWVRQYTNAGRGSFSTLEGRLESPDRSVWRVVSPGRSRESRLVSERVTLDRWRRTMSISSDGGTSWTELWRDELERSSEP